MDTILDIKKDFLSYIFSFITDRSCMGQYFLFYSCWVIALAYFFVTMEPVTAIMGYDLFMMQCNG